MTEDTPFHNGPIDSASASPVVSVVICFYNNVAVTKRCLAALSQNTPPGQYETILVDDGSEDPDAGTFASMPGIRLVRAEDNQGFTKSANLGASWAEGEYLVFLNNDTEVQAGWLDALLDAATDGFNVGAVGAMLIYPDGTIQEAGGVIWSDATGMNFGRGDAPDKSEYRYRREVDYCSGACLLVRKDLFKSIGGFDEGFSPGFYEDTDLCFAIRELGHTVLYEPRAQVVHVEGATFGTETRKGSSVRFTKCYQEVNRYRFLAKWATQLLRQNPPGTARGYRGGRRPDRPRVLVCDDLTCTPDRDSGSLRMGWILVLLHEMGCEVTFHPISRLERQPYDDWLRRAGIEVHTGPTTLEDLGQARPGHYDLVLMSRPHVSARVRDSVGRWFPRAVRVYDAVDLHFLREERRLALNEASPALRHAFRRERRMELDEIRAADIVTVVTEAERQMLDLVMPGLRTLTLPNIHSVRADPVPPAKGRSGLLFLGGYHHSPNIDAVHWFASEVLPRIELRSGETFTALGASPTPDLLALASQQVCVPGYVPVLNDHFDRARVFVAPLRFGAGMKGKLGMAMTLGLPIVTTTIGAEGMDLVDGVHALIADEPASFAEAVDRLRHDSRLWSKLSRNARELAAARWSPEHIRPVIHELMTSAVSGDLLEPRTWGRSDILGDFDGFMSKFGDSNE